MIGPLTTLIAYLLGSIPFGYLIVHWQRGIDVRATGSGSIGATNVMRNLGIMGFVATFILDAGKGLLAVLLASKMTSENPTWVAAAAFAAVFGHCFPVWLEISRWQRRGNRSRRIHCPRPLAGCPRAGDLRGRGCDLALHFARLNCRHRGFPRPGLSYEASTDSSGSWRRRGGRNHHCAPPCEHRPAAQGDGEQAGTEESSRQWGGKQKVEAEAAGSK